MRKKLFIASLVLGPTILLSLLFMPVVLAQVTTLPRIEPDLPSRVYANFDLSEKGLKEGGIPAAPGPGHIACWVGDDDYVRCIDSDGNNRTKSIYDDQNWYVTAGSPSIAPKESPSLKVCDWVGHAKLCNKDAECTEVLLCY